MAFEYLFTVLSSLPAVPGGKVALPARELARMCAGESEEVAALVRAMLVEFDIRAMERLSFGVAPGETATLSEEQVRSRQGLDPWLDSALRNAPQGDAGAYGFDCVWRAHFANMASVADEMGSGFLMRWACFDAGLRSAVAAHRASALKREAGAFSVADACDEPYDYRRVIDEIMDIQERGDGSWKAVDRALASARLARAREMSAAYSFDLDELLSYVVQFTVLKQGQYLS